MPNFNQRLKRLEGKLPEKRPILAFFEIHGYLDQSEGRKREIDKLCMERYPEAQQARLVIFIAGPSRAPDFSLERDVTFSMGTWKGVSNDTMKKRGLLNKPLSREHQ